MAFRPHETMARQISIARSATDFFALLSYSSSCLNTSVSSRPSFLWKNAFRVSEKNAARLPVAEWVRRDGLYQFLEEIARLMLVKSSSKADIHWNRLFEGRQEGTYAER